MDAIRHLAGRRAVVALLMAVTAVTVAWAQAPTVDELLVRLFTTENQDPYELTADFTGTLTLLVRGSRITATATGSYEEWRKSGDSRRRKVTIERLDVPLLLRPFRRALRRIIEEKVEAQQENPETFHAHDIFLLQELPGRRYALVGVHRSIVDDAIARFGRAEDKSDVATRRKIAQVLFTNPNMRSFLVRPGPPYAMRAVVDDDGHLHDLTIFYDWGEVSTRIAYTVISGVLAWQTVVSDAISELGGLGRVQGELVLFFTNHCLNCRSKPR